MKINKLFCVLFIIGSVPILFSQTVAIKKETSEKQVHVKEGPISSSKTKVSSSIEELRAKVMKSKQREAAMIGKELPYFEMVDIQGKSISSEVLKGKVTIVNFWYKECKPCIEEMPALNKLVEKYKDDKVQFIAFCTTQEQKLDGFFDKHPFNYRQIANSRSFARSSDIVFFPTSMVLDKEGKIAYVSSGLNKETVSSLEKEIQKRK